MRILIVGCGVIGHLYARGLSRSGHDVTLLGRDPAAVACFQSEGVEFVALRSGQCERLRLKYACGDPGRGHDLIMLAVRNDHLTGGVLEQVASWAGESSQLLLFHLGFSGPRLLPAVLPMHRVLIGYAINVGGFWEAPGRRICFDVPKGKNTAIGTLNEGINDRVKGIAQVFGESGFACQLPRMPDNVYQTSALIAALAVFDRKHPALLDGHSSTEDCALLGNVISDAFRVANGMCLRPRQLSENDFGIVGAQQALEFSRVDPISRALLTNYFRGGGWGEIEKLYGELIDAARQQHVAAPALNSLTAVREERT